MPIIKISTKGIKEITKALEKNVKKAEQVITATASDMRTRIPGYVADEVRGVYNIKKQEVMPAKKGKDGKIKKTAGGVRVSGVTIASVEIVYTNDGRMLTPTHFSMKPAKPLKSKAVKKKGVVVGRKRQRYEVTAEIKKSQRKALHPDAFLGSNNGGGYIPFRRTGARPYPIEAIKTLSLPQMVENEIVSNRIEKTINTELGKRLEHNINRIMK